MSSMDIRGRASRGMGLISLFLLVLVIAVVYVGGEWFVTQHVKTAVAEIVQQDTRQELEVEAVGMDGWLLSGKRSGDAVVVLPSGDRVPVKFSMIGNPFTGATITVEGEERLKLKLRELFGNFF